MSNRISGRLLVLCVCGALAAAAAPAAEERTEKAEKKEGSKKVRVITNADLEKYAKGGTPRRVVKGAPAPPLPLPPDGEEAAPLPPRTSLPAEELLDAATLPELEERQAELEELLTYLRAKQAWIKNPFLPQPTPPPTETLLDPSISGGQELQVTQSRIFAVETRLGKVRALIQAGGNRAPAAQP